MQLARAVARALRWIAGFLPDVGLGGWANDLLGFGDASNAVSWATLALGLAKLCSEEFSCRGVLGLGTGIVQVRLDTDSVQTLLQR